MIPIIQFMINYLKFENVGYSAKKFAEGLESHLYWNRDLTERQLLKLVEIYKEKSNG